MATAADLDQKQSYRVPHGFFTSGLSEIDPSVQDAIRAELRREQTQIELIASENIVSKAVLEAQGSVLTNKYAEGYPGRRYYQGCAPSDAVETLPIDSTSTFRVWALVMTLRFERDSAGRRNAFVALQRTPPRWFMWK